MKGHIAAAIAFEDLHAARRQGVGRGQYMSGFGIASQGNDGRMFEQQQHVTDLSSLAQIDQLLLQAEAFGVVNLTELDDGNHLNPL